MPYGSTFFTPANTRIQPLLQEGVVDALSDWDIVGFTPDSAIDGINGSIVVTAAATASETATLQVTANPAFQPFSGVGPITVNVSIVNGDSPLVIAQKLAKAFSNSFQLSSWFTTRLSGANLSFISKQAHDPSAFLNSLVITATSFTSTITQPTAKVPLPNIPVARLVYTPNGINPAKIRLMESGAAGIIRGITAWSPDVEFESISRNLINRPLYSTDVLLRGVLCMDGVNPVTAFASKAAGNLFVYVAGLNQGKIRVGADTGALALTPANFPNLVNLPSSTMSTFETSPAKSSLYRLRLEVA